MSGWQGVQAQVSPEQVSAVVEAAARELAGLPLAVLRNRRELGQRADAAVRTALRPFPVQVSPVQLQAMIAQVVAKVGGLGFLDGLIPPNSHAVHRRAGERRRPRLGPAQERHALRGLAVAAVEGRGVARGRGAVGPGGPGVLRVHPVGGRQDPAQPRAGLRRRARQDVAPDHRARRRLSLAGDAAVRAGAGRAGADRQVGRVPRCRARRAHRCGGQPPAPGSDRRHGDRQDDAALGAVPRHPARGAHREDRGPGGDLGAASQRDDPGGAAGRRPAPTCRPTRSPTAWTTPCAWPRPTSSSARCAGATRRCRCSGP